ncbi:hypothetical protein L208DRAFT_361336 [Tricholoma matsutake]|nr:hypothetical protein L208DRAFT_361336 [Tricholoma matsutake 945]
MFAIPSMFANSLFASISSIFHFILLLGLAFCRRRVWCRPYHLLFVRNNVIYSFRRLPNAIRSPLRTASSRMFSSSHLSMLCSSVTYLFPSSLPMFPLPSISSFIFCVSSPPLPDCQMAFRHPRAPTRTNFLSPSLFLYLWLALMSNSLPFSTIDSRPFKRTRLSPSFLSAPLNASPRSDTVAALYERLKKYAFVQVRGTPASGKTVLAQLLADHISQKDPNRVATIDPILNSKAG